MRRPLSEWLSVGSDGRVRARALPACVLILIACGGVCAQETPVPIDEPAEAELLQIAGDGFRIERTDHFVIAHNTSPDVLRSFLVRAERTYDAVFRFCRAGEIPVRAPSHRLAIVFFDRPEEFTQYGERVGFSNPVASGIFSIHLNRAAFFNTENTPRMSELSAVISGMEGQLAGGSGLGGNERRAVRKQLQRARNQREQYVTQINQLVIQHEVAHQVLYNIGVHTAGAQNPTWLAEGLACLFETPPGSKGAGFTAVNQARLRDFRVCLTAKSSDQLPQAGNLVHAYRSGELVPLKQLIGDAAFLVRGGNPHIANHYAQAWSLVFYLQRTQQKAFARYIQTIAQRRPEDRFTEQQEIEAFEAVFGPIDARFEQRWVGCVLNLPYRPGEIADPGL